MAEIRGFTYQEALQRIPKRRVPSFWVGDIDGLLKTVGRVNTGSCKTLTTSPGGHPIHVIAYGDAEGKPGCANYPSASGCGKRDAYWPKAQRNKPVVCFVGPIHGHEVEGLTGLANLIAVMETGSDLVGKKREELAELAAQCRLLLIPTGNPDGLARFAPKTLMGMYAADVRFWGQGTWSDHRFCGYPGCKVQHPMRGETVGFLGCYFNDEGINAVHDEMYAPMGQEACAILDVVRSEGPDIAVSLHSHEPAPAFLRPSFTPMEIQEAVRSLAAGAYQALARQGLPRQELFAAGPDTHAQCHSFNMISAIYHTCGAVSTAFECPHGVLDYCRVGFEQILEIQMTMIQSVLSFALDGKRQTGVTHQ